MPSHARTSALTPSRPDVPPQQGVVKNKAGSFGGSEEEAGGRKIAIGECNSAGEKQVDPATKLRRYKMDAPSERALQRFFAPYNKRLIAVLGFDPGWELDASTKDHPLANNL